MLFSFSFYLFLYISYYDFYFYYFLPLGTEKHGWPDNAVIV